MAIIKSENPQWGNYDGKYSMQTKLKIAKIY